MAASSSIHSSSAKISVAPRLSASRAAAACSFSFGRRCRLDLPSLSPPFRGRIAAPAPISARNRSRISASAFPVMEEASKKADSRVSTVVDVDLGSRSYPIYIGSGLLDEPDLLHRHVHGKSVLAVTNSTIAPLYLDKIIKALTHENPKITVVGVILPDMEKHKNMETLMKVFDKAIECRMDRRCTFVALDGGVIGDMSGFTAAAFLRGVNFIQIPTYSDGSGGFISWGENWSKPPPWEELDRRLLPATMRANRY